MQGSRRLDERIYFFFGAAFFTVLGLVAFFTGVFLATGLAAFLGLLTTFLGATFLAATGFFTFFGVAFLTAVFLVAGH